MRGEAPVAVPQPLRPAVHPFFPEGGTVGLDGHWVPLRRPPEKRSLRP